MNHNHKIIILSNLTSNIFYMVMKTNKIEIEIKIKIKSLLIITTFQIYLFFVLLVFVEKILCFTKCFLIFLFENIK